MSWSHASVLLSPAARERCVARLRNQPSFSPDPNKSRMREAAVLIPLCVVDNDVSVLYTVRSPLLKTHSGQVSFPGGMTDAGETAEQTALRETEEELGLPRSHIEVWGIGGRVPGRNNAVLITPVVGFINNYRAADLCPSPDEVEEAFTVPVKDLCDPYNHGFTKFKDYKFTLPVFIHDKHKIWGITAHITHMFLRCLVPKEHYVNDLSRNPINPDDLINKSKL